MRPAEAGSVICPSCGTPNKDEALFCKYCGYDLSKAPKPIPPTPPAPVAVPAPAIPAATPPLVPRPPRVRAWWHGVGVFVLVGVALVLIDLGANQRLTWSIVALLSAAFIVGGIMVLQYLATAERRDPRPLYAGALLLVAAVVLLPVAVALQSSPTYTETITVPSQSGVNTLALDVSDDVGHVSVAFAPSPGYLAQAVVRHLGGLFSSHYAGDVTNASSVAGGTLTFAIEAKTAEGLFFLGGHDIQVTIDASVGVTMILSSTTGNIEVVLSSGVRVAPGGISATVSTGNTAILATNPAFSAGASLTAVSTTGQVTVSINQTTAYAGTVPVTATSTTGSIAFSFTRATGIAAQVSSTVTTGSINYASSKYSGTGGLLYAPDQTTYTSGSTTMKFQVTLQTTTGNINLG